MPVLHVLYPVCALLTIEAMHLSFRRLQDALLALGFFVLIPVVVNVSSTLPYLIERGTWDDALEVSISSDGDPTRRSTDTSSFPARYPFPNVHSARRFVIVTISTVGYGEITPRSFFGRLVTLPLLLIALPSFVLGREFSIAWNEMAGGNTPRTPYTQSRQSFPSHAAADPLR
ncbi:hypothetical protein BGY98DRAFT_571329 [Russula aff. rugulosa BPL654]|nr:hypothetical protein BGY98DRAFT_571329 [Russula aff. rugulosa BPL654]